MKKSLSERIRALLTAGPVVGRTALQRDLWPSGWTLEDTADMNRTLNRMIADGEVVEQRREVPGAWEHAPAVEWVYSLADVVVVPAPARLPVVTQELGPYGDTWLVYRDGVLVDEVPC